MSAASTPHYQSLLFFTFLSMVEHVMTPSEHAASLRQFIETWSGKTDSMSAELKNKFASRLGFFISGDDFQKITDLFPKGHDPEKRVVDNALIIDDNDLCASSESFYQNLPAQYKQKIALFDMAYKNDILLKDIETLSRFVHNFSLQNFDLHCLYLHEKALLSLVGYAQTIITQNTVFLSKYDDERTLNDISDWNEYATRLSVAQRTKKYKDDNEEDREKDLDADNQERDEEEVENEIDPLGDYLSPISVTSHLTAYILQRASLENLRLTMK